MTDIEKLTKAVDELGDSNAELVKRNDELLKTIEEKGSAAGDLNDSVQKLSAQMTEKEAEIKKLQVAINRTPLSKDADKKEQTKEDKAFYSYLRKGIEGPELTKALTSSNDAQAGYAISDQQQEMFDLTHRELSPFRQLARVVTLSKGNRASWPVNLKGGVSFSWAEDTASTAESTLPSLGRKNVDAFLATSLALTTEELLEDSDMAIDQWLTLEATEEMVNGENVAFYGGNGVGKPRGFLTYAAGTSAGQIEQVISGSATTLLADGVINLQGALKGFYRQGAVFQAARATITTLRLLKDGSGNYLLINDFSKAGAPTLLGDPVIEATDMPAIAGAALPLAYGNFGFGYHIVDRKQITVQRFVEKYEPFIGFKFKKRVGGDVRREEAIKIQVVST